VVTLIAFPGILRDLLVIALKDEGFTLGSVVDSLSDVKKIENDECLVVYVESFDMHSVHEFRSFRSRHPEVPIEVISAAPIEPGIARQMGQFVNAIIPADRPLDTVIRSLSIVSEGYSIVDRRFSAAKVPLSTPSSHGRSDQSHDLEAADLSKRELSVLKKIGSGQSNKEIARDLEISDFTVKAHVRSILIKTGTKNRTQAAIWATAHLAPDSLKESDPSLS